MAVFEKKDKRHPSPPSHGGVKGPSSSFICAEGPHVPLDAPESLGASPLPKSLKEGNNNSDTPRTAQAASPQPDRRSVPAQEGPFPDSTGACGNPAPPNTPSLAAARSECSSGSASRQEKGQRSGSSRSLGWREASSTRPLGSGWTLAASPGCCPVTPSSPGGSLPGQNGGSVLLPLSDPELEEAPKTFDPSTRCCSPPCHGSNCPSAGCSPDAKYLRRTPGEEGSRNTACTPSAATSAAPAEQAMTRHHDQKQKNPPPTEQEEAPASPPDHGGIADNKARAVGEAEKCDSRGAQEAPREPDKTEHLASPEEGAPGSSQTAPQRSSLGATGAPDLGSPPYSFPRGALSNNSREESLQVGVAAIRCGPEHEIVSAQQPEDQTPETEQRTPKYEELDFQEVQASLLRRPLVDGQAGGPSTVGLDPWEVSYEQFARRPLLLHPSADAAEGRTAFQPFVRCLDSVRCCFRARVLSKRRAAAQTFVKGCCESPTAGGANAALSLHSFGASSPPHSPSSADAPAGYAAIPSTGATKEEETASNKVWDQEGQELLSSSMSTGLELQVPPPENGADWSCALGVEGRAILPKGHDLVTYVQSEGGARKEQHVLFNREASLLDQGNRCFTDMFEFIRWVHAEGGAPFPLESLTSPDRSNSRGKEAREKASDTEAARRTAVKEALHEDFAFDPDAPPGEGLLIEDLEFPARGAGEAWKDADLLGGAAAHVQGFQKHRELSTGCTKGVASETGGWPTAPQTSSGADEEGQEGEASTWWNAGEDAF
ncbi:hypothetical protein cyc_03275 [Cyclospora cayetanensis]|uniref:Uncharacterized protein n=1 Tax=Cyclospora cayetanensis TaxID=88456 RepID=A0A1D3CQY1_9EIME|nr:hypothetical protein cyc_03275 [Cyclospora cayetanensis]